MKTFMVTSMWNYIAKTHQSTSIYTIVYMSWTGVPSWAFSIPWEERLVAFGGYNTWVREVGHQEGGRAGFLGLFRKGSKGYALAL